MTHWTAPFPQDRKPRAGDTIENAAALATLTLGGDALIVRDSNPVYVAATNRTVAIHKDGVVTRFVGGSAGPLAWPVTVLWSPWDTDPEPEHDEPF